MSKESRKAYLDEVELPKNLLEDVESVCREKKLSSKKKKKLIESVKEEYLRSLFESGEAIGIVTAQSISEQATQMCLDHDERIILKSGDGIEVVKIGDFVEESFAKSGFRKVNGYDVCDLQEDMFVLSLNQDEKLEWRRIISCNRHESPEKLMKIKTKSGREITATDFHSFVTRKHNEIVPISGKDLKVGDRVPVIKHFPVNCTKFLDLQSVLSEKNIVRKNGRISTINSRPLPAILRLDDLFGWFVGAYLADGSWTKYYTGISNTDENFLSKARKFSDEFGFTFNEYDNFRGFSKGHDIHINSTLLSHLLKKLCGKGSDSKKIPGFVFGADERFVAGLLRGYFDGDGNVTVERKMIRVSSNSEELIDGVKLLLTRFGIFASKSKEEKQFCLTIPYKFSPVFLEKIGSDLRKNHEKLKKLAEMSEKFWKERSQDFIDMIPGFDDILYRVAKKLKYPTRFVNGFTKNQKIGRTTLYRHIRLFEKIANEKNIDIEEELEILKRMFNSDVVWDEITEISYTEPGFDHVYDLSVDGLRTFTTFDGVITHNTMRTFHFAGSVGVQVTLGLPRLIEIFDARKKPKTPMMTLYMDKKYNKKKYSEKLAEEIVEKRLKNFLRSVSLDLTNRRLKVKLKKLKKTKKRDIVRKVKRRFRMYKVIKRRRTITIESKKKKEKLTIDKLQSLKKKVLNFCVGGIPKIKNTLVVKKGKDWVINTFGTNFQRVLKLDKVDPTRSYTNDIHELAEALGIEAARNIIIRETCKTMEQQGLDVNERHILLLADIMTFYGEVNAIGRYGVAGLKRSVLSRAGFEETVKHLIKASVRHEVDDFKAVFDNVMINQQVPVGTGMFDLIARMGEE